MTKLKGFTFDAYGNISVSRQRVEVYTARGSAMPGDLLPDWSTAVAEWLRWIDMVIKQQEEDLRLSLQVRADGLARLRARATGGGITI